MSIFITWVINLFFFAYPMKWLITFLKLIELFVKTIGTKNAFITKFYLSFFLSFFLFLVLLDPNVILYIYIYIYLCCNYVAKGSRKGRLLAVEVVYTEEYRVVEERGQWKSMNYVRMLVIMSSLTLLICLKGPTSKLPSKCGVELQILLHLIISKLCLNFEQCKIW